MYLTLKSSLISIEKKHLTALTKWILISEVPLFHGTLSNMSKDKSKLHHKWACSHLHNAGAFLNLNITYSCSSLPVPPSNYKYTHTHTKKKKHLKTTIKSNNFDSLMSVFFIFTGEVKPTLAPAWREAAFFKALLYYGYRDQQLQHISVISWIQKHLCHLQYVRLTFHLTFSLCNTSRPAVWLLGREALK